MADGLIGRLREWASIPGPVRSLNLPAPSLMAGDSFEQNLADRLASQALSTGDIPINLSRSLGATRNSAVAYIALSRCVTLISGVAASLVCGGNLRVEDRDGMRIDNRRIRSIMDTLTWTPDRGRTAGHSFIEDVMADYCLDGNSLLVPKFGMNGMLTRLERFRPWDATLTYGNGEMPAYHMIPADSIGRSSEYHAATDVIHIRWPRCFGTV